MRLRRLLGRGDEPDDEGRGDARRDPDGDDLARAMGGDDTDADERAEAQEPDEADEHDDAEGGDEVDEPDTADAGADDGDGAEEGSDAAGDAAEEGGDAEPAAEGPQDEGDEDDDDDEDDEPQQIAFELADWGARERKMLDDQLGALRIARAWEAGTLVVGAADADVVDDVIDEIEERTALDLAPGVEPVTYEVGDWPIGLEDRFIEALIDARIPHQRAFREISIGVDDEERVDEIVEAVTEAWELEQPTEEELDGPDAQHVLSELFVTSDRLLHDASDRPATVRFDDAATSVEEMALPFGFAAADWDQVTARVAALRLLLADADATDDQIAEAATELRSTLRPLV